MNVPKGRRLTAKSVLHAFPSSTLYMYDTRHVPSSMPGVSTVLDL
eukprot:COSAG02_NODE_2229_length_9437_cov_7.217205_4_plen_45_part_00